MVCPGNRQRAAWRAEQRHQMHRGGCGQRRHDREHSNLASHLPVRKPFCFADSKLVHPRAASFPIAWPPLLARGGLPRASLHRGSSIGLRPQRGAPGAHRVPRCLLPRHRRRQRAHAHLSQRRRSPPLPRHPRRSGPPAPAREGMQFSSALIRGRRAPCGSRRRRPKESRLGAPPAPCRRAPRG